MRAPDHHRRPSRTRVVVAVAAAVAAMALVAGLIVAGTRADEDPVPADEPEPTVLFDRRQPGRDTVRPTPDEQAAIDVAEQYFAAFAAGDVDTVLALSVPASLTPSAESEAGVVAWWSITSRPGGDADGWPTGRCRVTTGDASAPDTRVDCPVAVRDPVAVALDVDQLEWGVFVTDDGLVERLAEPLAGFKNYQPAWKAYADYLQTTRPTDYANVCDPAAYDAGTIHSTSGIAITATCAELVADVSDEVATWIDNGRPELTPGT